MKRILIILSILVLLSVGFAGPVAAGGSGGTPDVIPPVISGIGITSPVYLSKVCPDMNQILMVQAKVADAGGIQRVWVQGKLPGDTAWHNLDMTLRSDGYWRAFADGPWMNAGTGVYRIRAMDWGGNVTTSGIKSFDIYGCSKTIH
jgi:hypothetical protein